MSDTRKNLSGTGNKRLDNVKATNKEATAAWADISKQDPETNVTIPSEYSVKKAKNWVDNGSQL